MCMLHTYIHTYTHSYPRLGYHNKSISDFCIFSSTLQIILLYVFQLTTLAAHHTPQKPLKCYVSDFSSTGVGAVL